MTRSRKLWKIEPFSSNTSNMYVDTYPRPVDKRIIRYHCIFCDREATQIVYYKVDGIQILEKYCDECISAKKIKIRIPTHQLGD